MEKETLKLLRFVSDSRETGLDPVSDKGKNQGFSASEGKPTPATRKSWEEVGTGAGNLSSRLCFTLYSVLALVLPLSTCFPT